MSELLNIEHLSVSFAAEEGKMEAVRDVSFSLKSGEVLAIVGESGCGKSVLCKSIMKLLPKNGWIEKGSIAVNGEDIAAYPEKKMQKLRGKHVFYGISGSDECTGSDGPYRQADR